MNALPVRAMHLALAVVANAGAASATAAGFVQEPDQAIEIPRPPWMEPSPPAPPPAVAPDRPVLPPIIDPPAEVRPAPAPPASVPPPPPPAPPKSSPAPAPGPGGGAGGGGESQRPVPDTPPAPRRSSTETPQNAAASLSAGRWTYVGASLGASQWNIKETEGIRVDGSGSALKLFVGHRYGPWWRAQVGAEAGFVDLGKASQDSVVTGVTRFKVNGLYLDGVLGQTVWPRVWVQGQLGLFYGRSDTSPGSRAASVGLKWGVGVAYELTPRWSLRGDWESYPVKAKEASGTSRSNLSALTIGTRYRF